MSESVLDKIVADRRKSIPQEKNTVGIDQLRNLAMSQPTPLSLSAVMKMKGVRLIAEIKPARPSVGTLKEGFSVREQAEAYYVGGASAISVLTEPDHFQGSWMNLRAAKEFSTLPTLCKDFIFDKFQLEMARAYGADAVLLIAAALDDLELKRLCRAAHKLEMEVLTEATNKEELERVLAGGSDLIGINSRNLDTLEVDFDGALELASTIKDRRPVIMESGISTRADVKKVEKAGIEGILVGTVLMKADDPAGKIRELLETEGPVS